MLPTVLCLAVFGLVCGLFLLHWLSLAVLSLAGSVIFVLASPWHWLLLPKWFGLLTVFQLAYLGGAAIRLWMGEVRRSELESSAAAPAQNLQGERILIVEDEPLVAADLAQEVKTASGHPIGPAASVAEALRIIEGEVVDAAVLDVKPTDGEVTPVALKVMDRNVPFAILTGEQTPRDTTARRPRVTIFRKPVPTSSTLRSLTEQIHRLGRRRKRTLKGP